MAERIENEVPDHEFTYAETYGLWTICTESHVSLGGRTSFEHGDWVVTAAPKEEKCRPNANQYAQATRGFLVLTVVVLLVIAVVSALRLVGVVNKLSIGTFSVSATSIMFVLGVFCTVFHAIGFVVYVAGSVSLTKLAGAAYGPCFWLTLLSLFGNILGVAMIKCIPSKSTVRGASTEFTDMAQMQGPANPMESFGR